MSIYRFKLAEELLDTMKVFADIHALDDLKTFKESFEKWYEDNTDIVQCESDRLKQIGYKGELKNKIFKSIRYYYRKKPKQETKPPNEKPARKKVFCISSEVLDCMDRIIKNQYTQKPSQLFEQFLDQYQTHPEVEGYIQKDILKVKKSFKNRMFKHKLNILN